MNIIEHFNSAIETKSVRETAATNHSVLSVKYRPTCIDDWMDNPDAIQTVHQWFMEEMPDKRCLIVTGLYGTGKSSLIDLFARHYKKTLYTIPSNNKRSKKEVSVYYEKVKSFYVHGLFFLDDFELFVNRCDNISLSELHALLFQPNCKMRCILAVNLLCLSKMTVFHPLSVMVTLQKPEITSVYTKCVDILKKEDFAWSPKYKSVLMQYIEKQNGIVRRVFDSLLFFQQPHLLERYSLEMDMYSIYKHMLQPDVSFSDKLGWFYNESGTLPIIAQENYLDYKMSKQDIYRVSNCMSLADIYHKASFIHNQCIGLDTYACLSVLCVNTVANKTLTEKPRFGLIWTKQSASYQKRKYFNEFQVHHKQIHNTLTVLYMSDVMKHVLFSNHASQVVVRMFHEWSMFWCTDPEHKASLYHLFCSFSLTKNNNKPTYTKKRVMAQLHRFLK